MERYHGRSSTIFYYCDSGKALLKRRWNELRPHGFDSFGWHESLTLTIPALADLRGRIEKQRFNFAAERMRNPNIRRPFGDGHMRRVDVRDRSAEHKAPPQQIAHRREYLDMNRLICRVIGQRQADRIRRDRVDSELLKVRRFARSGKSNGDDDARRHSEARLLHLAEFLGHVGQHVAHHGKRRHVELKFARHDLIETVRIGVMPIEVMSSDCPHTQAWNAVR